uniref:Uncharacterized protein n=1 Tax=Sphenodon punctatus TaxID=8508 RepID=A0A8D0G7M4_SPHPU
MPRGKDSAGGRGQSVLSRFFRPAGSLRAVVSAPALETATHRCNVLVMTRPPKETGCHVVHQLRSPDHHQG